MSWRYLKLTNKICEVFGKENLNVCQKRLLSPFKYMAAKIPKSFQYFLTPRYRVDVYKLCKRKFEENFEK